MARRDRARVTRCRILRAALCEFAQRGFDRASVKSVSEAAGVANGTVYWHFASKSGLYLAVVQHASEDFHVGVAQFASAKTSFIDVVDREIAYLRENPEIDAVLSPLRGAHPRADAGETERLREAARVVDGRLVDVWRRWIGIRQRCGNATLSERDDLARLIASTVSGLLARRFIDPGMDVRAALTAFGTLVETAHGGAA